MNSVETLSHDALLKGLLDLLPFKGKGEARRQRDAAWQQWQATARAMKALSLEFRERFAATMPVTLVVMKGRQYSQFLRWRRTTKGAQTTLQLCGDEAGHAILAALPSATRAEFLRFDARATALNASCQLRSYQHWVLDEYLRRTEAWEQEVAAASDLRP